MTTLAISRPISSRAVHLKIKPAPSTLYQTSAIFGLLRRRFGEVEHFKHLRYEGRWQPDTCLTIFRDVAAANRVLNASPLRCRMEVGGDVHGEAVVACAFSDEDLNGSASQVFRPRPTLRDIDHQKYTQNSGSTEGWSSPLQASQDRTASNEVRKGHASGSAELPRSNQPSSNVLEEEDTEQSRSLKEAFFAILNDLHGQETAPRYSREPGKQSSASGTKQSTTATGQARRSFTTSSITASRHASSKSTPRSIWPPQPSPHTTPAGTVLDFTITATPSTHRFDVDIQRNRHHGRFGINASSAVTRHLLDKVPHRGLADVDLHREGRQWRRVVKEKKQIAEGRKTLRELWEEGQRRKESM